MWISISWEKNSHIDNVPSIFTFDADVILSYKQNSFNILYEDGKIYNVKLQRNNWFKCLKTPPTRPYQWRLLSKKVSLVPFNFLECFQRTDMHYLQVDVILQHEQNELNDNLLFVDTNQPKLSKELIGRWISIAYNRECFGEDILVYDVGEIMDVKKIMYFLITRRKEALLWYHFNQTILIAQSLIHLQGSICGACSCTNSKQ